VLTVIVGIHPVHHLLCRQHPCRLHHHAFAMDPFGFNRVELRASTRQPTGNNPDTTVRLFDLPIMGTPPGLARLTLMPRGVVPDQEQGAFLHGYQAVAAPCQKRHGLGTHRLAGHKAQPELCESGAGRAEQPPIARARALGSGLSFGTVFSTRRRMVATGA
jgi:hypothetical protein